MSDKLQQFYKRIITSEPVQNSLPREFVSKQFLKDTGAKVRLIFEKNILNDYNHARAFFSKLGDNKGFLLKRDAKFYSTEVTIDFDFLYSYTDVAQSSVIISDQALKNLLVLRNDNDHQWIVGEDDFIRQSEPYPLEIMKAFYLNWLGDDAHDPTSREFWALWKEYEPFMLE